MSKEKVEYKEVTMIDDDTAVIDCKMILAQIPEGGKEPLSKMLNGHILSTLDVETGAATITFSAMDEARLSIAVPFWAVNDVINAQLLRYRRAIEEAAERAKKQSTEEESKTEG